LAACERSLATGKTYVLEAEMVTSNPDITAFHKTLYHILCSREPVAKRIEDAEAAIAIYSATLQRSLSSSAPVAGVSPAAMVDRHLANIETQLKTWKELFRVGTDIVPVCDGALRAVRAARQKIVSGS
jgi:hypothetical protein